MEQFAGVFLCVGLVLLLALYIPSRFKSKNAISDSGYADKFSHSLRVLKDIKEQMLAHEENESKARAQSFDSRHTFGLISQASITNAKSSKDKSGASKVTRSKRAAQLSRQNGQKQQNMQNTKTPPKWVKVSGTVVNTTAQSNTAKFAAPKASRSAHQSALIKSPHSQVQAKYVPEEYIASEAAKAFAKLPQVQEVAKATGEFESAKVLVKNFDPTSRTSSAAYKSLFAAELGETAKLVRRLDAELEYVSNSAKRYKQANR